MAATSQAVSAPPPAAGFSNPGKRKRPPKGKGKGNKNKKLARSDQDDSVRRRRNKPSAKFLKLLRKRARDYNSDDEEEDDDRREEHPPSRRRDDHDEEEEESLSHSEPEDDEDDDEEGASSSAVTRFEQGCRAFRVAFLKIMGKKLPDDPLGPIMSAHKTLVAAKLAEDAEDAEERKPKWEVRKEKQVAAEKGHVIPKDHLDSKEKELIKIATKGVVRLFNAVSKAQKPRKDLNPSSTKDAKVLAKETKKTFLAELDMPSHQDKKSKASSNFSKHTGKDEDEPAWAPLRDTYLLGTKLKDWDKMKDSAGESEQTKAPLSDSSDEE